jgi:hypothetical protein
MAHGRAKAIGIVGLMILKMSEDDRTPIRFNFGDSAGKINGTDGSEDGN